MLWLEGRTSLFDSLEYWGHTHTRVTDELPLMVLACTAQKTSFGVKDSGAGHSTDQAKGLLVHWTEVDPEACHLVF